MTSDAEAYGKAVLYMLRLAFACYEVGEMGDGDSHAALAYNFAREAGRRANQELDASERLHV